MKKVILAALLLSSPAMAQTSTAPVADKTAPPAAAAGAPSRSGAADDICYPIGKTYSGLLVYAMTCANVPYPGPPLRSSKRKKKH